MDQQEQRGVHLRSLMRIYHSGSTYGDYEHEYEVFEATYFGTVNGEDVTQGDNPEMERELIPKYASIAEDETYGMISTCDSLEDALHHQAVISDMGDTLNVPAGIVDLDTGKKVPYKMIALTEDAIDVIGDALAITMNLGHVDRDAAQQAIKLVLDDAALARMFDS